MKAIAKMKSDTEQTMKLEYMFFNKKTISLPEA